jgi:hypothetical protein
MPNRSVHVAVSTPAGVCFSIYKSKFRNDLYRFVEGCGGVVGGLVGGLLPDLIDAPTCRDIVPSDMASFQSQ